jgi:hypothetical protein
VGAKVKVLYRFVVRDSNGLPAWWGLTKTLGFVASPGIVFFFRIRRFLDVIAGLPDPMLTVTSYVL